MTNSDLRRSLKEHTDLLTTRETYRNGMSTQDILLSFADHLEYSLAKDQYTATARDLYQSLALTTRDRLADRWIETQQVYYNTNAKRVYYLSAEYLMGRALINNLMSLGIYEEAREALAKLNLDLADLAEPEPDAGLGNGGLGRLAACFLDSFATLGIPACGYGIRYEFGIFDQVIRRLGQAELPDEWLKHGNPWEIARPERSCLVQFYGRTEETTKPDGSPSIHWVDTQELVGVPYDTPIGGYDNGTVNTLRLWSARASTEFDLEYFQHGDYLKAVEQKNVSENISKVLYPADDFFEGRELRLKQQYFFVSCSIQDIIRRYLVKNQGFQSFPDKVAIQLNDTHPSLAIPELMRILMDDYNLSWDEAWDITQRTCAYTNHTLLAEAMEKWPVSMFGRLLPRHLGIIYEINRRFLRDVAVRYVGRPAKTKRMSLIEEGAEKKIRMAHLAMVGSHSVNGVAALHTKLLVEREFKDFSEMFPGRFNSKTNGITPRRWLLAANPGLARLITSRIGADWITDLSQLRRLEEYLDDAGFRAEWTAVKRANKQRLAKTAFNLTGAVVDPDTIFDIQVKRVHEYKRQLLNILHVVVRWLELKENPELALQPRTYFFGGKAAPGYFIAKKIIELVCHVAEMINKDPTTSDRIKVVFLPNYRVSLAEVIIPACDVSEQISTAGYEASGTGNMKFALNGALTIGTLDGANIEIMEEVGADNIFIFGLTADEVNQLRPTYQPYTYYEKTPLLKRAIDLISDGFFSPEHPALFHPLTQPLLHQDNFLVLADFEHYHRCQDEVGELYSDQEQWVRKAILNVARIGKFSSDRTIAEYNRDIWHAETLQMPK